MSTLGVVEECKVLLPFAIPCIFFLCMCFKNYMHESSLVVIYLSLHGFLVLFICLVAAISIDGGTWFLLLIHKLEVDHDEENSW